MVALSACSATARIGIDANANGTGMVAVTVTLDRQAVATVGDVAAQLQTSDMTAAGWQVSTPAHGPNGSEILRATHPFSSFAQVGPLVDQVAGNGPPASRPFQFALTRHHGFWTTTTRFRGTVNLACGLGCFGDPGLASQLGTSTGINPAAVQAETGMVPAQVFHFQVVLRLPGGATSTNATTRSAGSVGWQPVFGQVSHLLAVTQSTNTQAVAEVAAAAAVVVVGLLVIVVVAVVRRRGGGRRRRGAHVKS